VPPNNVMTYRLPSFGGTADSGTIFQCSASGTFTTLVNLNSSTGAYPYGNLIQAFDGNLYGMTQIGGSSNLGTIFKCTTSGEITTLVNFNDTNGANPLSSLIQASDSNLYGTTAAGGASGAGTIFKYTTSGQITTLANLTGALRACTPLKEYNSLIELKNPTGINNIVAADSKLIVYPNPSSNNINLLLKTPVTNATIRITDMTGKEVISTYVLANDKPTSIGISNLSHGMYFVEVITEKKTEVEKFIKE